MEKGEILTCSTTILRFVMEYSRSLSLRRPYCRGCLLGWFVHSDTVLVALRVPAVPSLASDDCSKMDFKRSEYDAGFIRGIL